MTRPGYLTWRAKLKTRAATQVSELLGDSAIATESRERIAALIRKEGLAGADADDDIQALEDAACLVFLDDQLDGFESRPDVDEDKIVGILQKTWGKMSEPGRQLALAMDLSDRGKALVGKALQS
jgi:hypothetical protein